MHHQETKLAVLARFPDLSATSSPAGDEKPLAGGILVSTGRMIGQAVSFKLLAGIMLFLVVGAVLPFFVGKDRPAAGELSSSDSETIDSTKPASELADAATAQGMPLVQPTMRRPVVVVPIAAEPSSAPAIVPSRFEVESEAKSASAAESPQMSSSWMPPAATAPLDARPSGVEGQLPGINNSLPTATRPSEHQAGAIR